MPAKPLDVVVSYAINLLAHDQACSARVGPRLQMPCELRAARAQVKPAFPLV